MVTEREWRRQAVRARRKRRFWGAPCVMTRGTRLARDRAFRAFLLLASLLLSLCMPRLATLRAAPVEYPTASGAAASARASVREVNAVAYAVPDGLARRAATFTRAQLLRGKLLLLDGAHPLPGDAPAPNTFSIASLGKGMIPVNGLDTRSGRETVQALAKLFAYARARGVTDLCVWRATQSLAERGAKRLARMRELCAALPPDEAAARTRREFDAPFAAEFGQEYTAEIRLRAAGEAVPDERPLGATDSGRFLTQNAWRFGFIQRDPAGEGPCGFRFRYVGEAHATAMRFLDLNLDEYLALLHERRVVSVSLDGALRYLILCEPMGEKHAEFLLPEGAACEASMDNAGWAVAACSFPQ